MTAKDKTSQYPGQVDVHILNETEQGSINSHYTSQKTSQFKSYELMTDLAAEASNVATQETETKKSPSLRPASGSTQ